MPPLAAGVVAASCLVVHTTPLAEGGIEIPLAKLIGFTYAISYCRKFYKFFCIITEPLFKGFHTTQLYAWGCQNIPTGGSA